MGRCERPEGNGARTPVCGSARTSSHEPKPAIAAALISMKSPYASWTPNAVCG